jgi:Ribbon-helix-helix protein, copG family
VGMARTPTGRPVGRPKGTRTATVELETLSFKVPAEFKAQLQAYAKQRRQSISELIREGIEWRIGEGDPLTMRYGTVTSGETAYEGNTGNTDKAELGIEFLHGMLSALVAEVRQLHISMQTIEQRLGEHGSMQAPSVTGNTDVTSVNGDMPVASRKAQSTLGRTSVRVLPEFDPAKYALGPLCVHGHDYGGSGQSLRQRIGKHECVECTRTRKRAYKKRQRQAEAPGTTGLGH